MRTLVVIHSLKLGGMERVAVNLADAFADQGHDSHLLACKSQPNDIAPSHPDVKLHHYDQLQGLLKSGIGIPVFLLSRLLLGVLIPKSHFFWTGWLSGWLLKRHIRQIEQHYGRFDRIIFRGLGTFKYFWSFRDSRASYVLENIIHRDGPFWKKKLEWRLVFSQRELVCVSSGVKASAEAAFQEAGIVPASLRVITNPCPIERIRALAEENPPGIPCEPYIVNVARLVPQKGHELLLEAYAAAAPSQKLVIVGDGASRQALKVKANELGIAERVLFAGLQANPYPWMRNADLFVLSSEYEGLGIVLTEALACGTPIVSVDCRGGVRDVFKGELESFLAPRTVDGLAARITEVLGALPITVKDEWLADFKPDAVVRQFLLTDDAASGQLRQG